MKKIISLMALAIVCSVAVAQTPTPPPVPQKANRYVAYSETNKGFWGGVDFNIGAGFSKMGASMPLGLEIALGYRVNEFFKVGAGFGGEYVCWGNGYHYSEDGGLQNWNFPVYLDLRGDIFPRDYRSAVPFWRFDAGYAFNEGAFFSPCFGVSFGSDPRNHFLLGLAYKGQMGKVVVENELKDALLSIVQLKLSYEF